MLYEKLKLVPFVYCATSISSFVHPLHCDYTLACKHYVVAVTPLKLDTVI